MLACSKQSHLTAFTFSLFETQPRYTGGHKCKKKKTELNFFVVAHPKVVQTFTYSQSCTACLVAVCYGDTSVRSLFRCLSRTVSEIRSAAASSIHAARGGSHGARYQTRCRHHGNRAPLQPIKTPPLLSPLVTAAARGASRARTPSIFLSPPFFRRRANVAFTSTLSRVRLRREGRGHWGRDTFAH